MTNPVTGWIGVGTSLSGGVLSEPSPTNTYARQPVSIDGTSGALLGGASIPTFAPQAETWGTLTSWALFDANGNVLYAGALVTAVTPVAGLSYAMLPGTVALTPGSPQTAATPLLAAWAPPLARIVPLANSGGQTRKGSNAQPAPTLLADRTAGAISDDTIDMSAVLGAGDALATVALTCADPSVTIKWVAFQGSLITVRSTGGDGGQTYASALTWTNASGSGGSDVVTQFVQVLANSGAQGAGQAPATQSVQQYIAGQLASLASGAVQPSAVALTPAGSTIANATPITGAINTIASPVPGGTQTIGGVLCSIAGAGMLDGFSRTVRNYSSEAVPIYPLLGKQFGSFAAGGAPVGVGVNVPWILMSGSSLAFDFDTATGFCIATG